MKGNKTDRKDAKWICALYMCGMIKPSFIPPADIRELRENPSSPGQDAVLEMIKTIAKSNRLGFPVLVLIFNQYWYKLQML